MTSPKSEDKRTAASLVITLSSLVVTASLAVLGAQAIIATFVIDNRENLDLFYVVSAAGTIALVVSIIVGGKGIYEIIEHGADADWRIKTDHHLFELQAILVLAGTILVVASAFLGDAKETQQAISSWAAMLPG